MENKPASDITLLLEGTYPFVRGGVSSWVHQLIEGLPQFTFSLAFIGAKKCEYNDYKYTLPDNVVQIDCEYLWDADERVKPKPCPGSAKYIADTNRLHDWFKNCDMDYDEDAVKKVLALLGKKEGFTLDDFLFSEASWNRICDSYDSFCNDDSFIDYIWTIRAMHTPLFKLARFAERLADTSLYHSVSTGYAGFLGSLLHTINNKPLILTEHGIYTKERKIDLQSSFLREYTDYFDYMPDMGMTYKNKLWINYFASLGRLVYKNADPVISLYEKNRQRQIKDGADKPVTRVIPNGIHVENFKEIRDQRDHKIPMVIGLLGRIVPIKDIKTFIRSMSIVLYQLPEAEVWIIGPEDEDEQYVSECKSLVKSFSLESKIHFLGFRKITEILPRLGLLVLTSISEAFPLVLLEAFVSGLPVVTTDVGACREIIEGAGPEDQALGSAGMVVPIASPEATAHAVLMLLTDESRWRAATKAGLRRVERYYTQAGVLASYSEIYSHAMKKS